MTVPVYQELVMVPVGEIKPYHRNARKNSATVDKLVEILPKVGFNVPLVLDRANVIVKGHSRWKAAIKLGMTEIPCVYTDADAETNKLDRLADNRVQEFSLWDEVALGSELASLNLDFSFDLGMLNFKVDLPSIDTSWSFALGKTAAPAAQAKGSAEDQQPAEPAVAAAADKPAAATEKPFITAQDVERTVSQVKNAEYLEVLCDNCGHRLHVKK